MSDLRGDRLQEIEEMILAGWGDTSGDQIPPDWRNKRPRLPDEFSTPACAKVENQHVFEFPPATEQDRALARRVLNNELARRDNRKARRESRQASMRARQQRIRRAAYLKELEREEYPSAPGFQEGAR